MLRTSLAALLVLAPNLVLADPAADTAAAVRAADLAFETRAQAVGAAQAFREFMDPTDGLEFGSGPPIRGAEAIYKSMRGDTGHATLQWAPTDAWGSASGDLGVTTGTWRLLDGSRPPITGRYVTVWRKDAAGQWKGLIDIGSPDPVPPKSGG